MSFANSRFLVIVSVFLATLVSAGAAQAGKAKDKMNAQVLSQYVAIQETLAKDSTAGLAQAAEAIAKSAPSEAIKNAAAKLAKFKTIDEARETFKGLSVPVVEWTKKAKPAGYDIVNCPMAKADWVQKTGEVANPYYGSSMLTCGERVGP